MRAVRQSSQVGFTIVEAILTVAITGLMAVGAMLSVRGVINNQRYNDSINSFRDFLRTQYNNVITTDIAIRSAGIQNYCGSAEQRGRTECYVLGRLLKFEHDKVSIYGVISRGNPPEGVAPNDEDYFKWAARNLRVVGEVNFTGDIVTKPNPIEEYRLDWDAKLKQPNGSNNPSKFVLIVRSPVSGSVRTYAMKNESSPDRTGLDRVLEDLVMLSQQTLTYESQFCVHPEGFAFTNRRAVVIKPNGSNASAVEIAPLDGEVNGVKAVRCN